MYLIRRTTFFEIIPESDADTLNASLGKNIVEEAKMTSHLMTS